MMQETKKPDSPFSIIAEMSRAILRKAKGLAEKAEVSLKGDRQDGKYIAVALDRNGYLSTGRAGVKGRRKNAHWNKKKLEVNSKAHDLTRTGGAILAAVRRAEGAELTPNDIQLLITASAKKAFQIVERTRHERKRLKRAMRDASRRVQRGTIAGNSKAARVAYTAPE